MTSFMCFFFGGLLFHFYGLGVLRVVYAWRNIFRDFSPVSGFSGVVWASFRSPRVSILMTTASYFIPFGL